MELQELFTAHGDISQYPPERRILIAALDCIQEGGLKGATVRAIAARAGLNPAAINYYFRSKDRVIEEALRGAWTHLAEDIDLILKETKDRDAVPGIAVNYLLEGSAGSPKIIRAIILEHPVLRVEAARFLTRLFARIAGSGTKATRGSLAALLMVSVGVLLAIAPDAAAALSGVDLSRPAARTALSRELSLRVFGTGRLRTGGRKGERAGGRTGGHQKASPRLK